MYALTQIIPPTLEAVTLSELKGYLRVDLADDDAQLAGLNAAARQWCEDYTGRQFVTATWRLRLDGFNSEPCYDEYENVIRLPRPPLQAVSGVQYLESSSGVLTTWSSSSYRVDNSTEPGRLSPEWAETWPVVRLVTNAVTITYTAGYGAPSAVPASAKLAIMLLASHWYDTRSPVLSTGAVPQEVSLSVSALLDMIANKTYV